MINSDPASCHEQQVEMVLAAPLPKGTHLTDRRSPFAGRAILSMPCALRVSFVLAPAEATKADLLAAMEGHVLGRAELTRLYTPQP
jgi:hypothetical protein